VCVLPDGRLVSGSSDSTIRLWDLARGAEAARLEGHSDWVTALCVLPDSRLASGSEDNTIRLWDVARGAEAARLEQCPAVLVPART
jgi:WD40 repeat protein